MVINLKVLAADTTNNQVLQFQANDNVDFLDERSSANIKNQLAIKGDPIPLDNKDTSTVASKNTSDINATQGQPPSNTISPPLDPNDETDNLDLPSVLKDQQKNIDKDLKRPDDKTPITDEMLQQDIKTNITDYPYSGAGERRKTDGLMTNIVEGLQSTNLIPGTNKSVTNVVNDSQSVLSKGIGAIRTGFTKLFSFGAETDPTPQTIAPPPKPKSAASAYPNILFEDVKYYNKNTTMIPITLHNDKSNPENRHIPPYNQDAIYIAYFHLFEYAKDVTSLYKFSKVADVIDNFDVYDVYRNTPLIYAVRYNNLHAVKIFLYKRANPNICNKKGICPIHLAAFNGQSYIYLLLKDSHANLAQPDSYNITPLMYALYGGNFNIFKDLLTSGAYRINRKMLIEIANIAYNNENIQIYTYINKLLTTAYQKHKASDVDISYDLLE